MKRKKKKKKGKIPAMTWKNRNIKFWNVFAGILLKNHVFLFVSLLLSKYRKPNNDRYGTERVFRTPKKIAFLFVVVGVL